MAQKLALPEFKLENWWPMPPSKGPPLPFFLAAYWPWYIAPGAEFKVSDLVILPTEVQVGNPVTISCAVENIGTESGDYLVKLGGDFMADQEVTLAPGESQTVAFDVTPAVAKNYAVNVDGLYGTFKATEVPVADIRVKDLVISPSEVNVGETVTITVTAINYGTAPGTKLIVCNVT